MEQSLHVLASLLGAVMVLAVVGEGFEVIVLPRRIVRRFRVVTVFYHFTWAVWRELARRISAPKRREWLLSLFGPLSLLMLLTIWACGAIVGFALLAWGLWTPMSGGAGASAPEVYLYWSGVTFFTLGYGDVAPLSYGGRVLAVVEAGTGFGLLAVVIGYLPVIYQAFSRREAAISLLDARAGSPPTAQRLVVRHVRQEKAFETLLNDWERWSAELLESHLSYPILAYFRSQHSNQSWLTALTTVLDASVLVLAVLEDGPEWQAQLTFAMARHAVVDLAQVYTAPPLWDMPDRLPPADLAVLEERLAAAGYRVRQEGVGERVQGLRRMYEPYVHALAERLLLVLPAWTAPEVVVENWRTSAWEAVTSHAASLLLGGEPDEHED